MIQASPRFDDYRAKYPSRAADLARKQFDDEIEDLSRHPDVFSVNIAPSETFVAGEPRREHMARNPNMYLWLVRMDDVVAAVEEGDAGRTRQRGRLAHTNLSGGAPAHCGGELWFRDGRSMWITGGSSRYRARNSQELDDLSGAFRSAGYRVCSAGWSPETDEPVRMFRGDDVWA